MEIKIKNKKAQCPYCGNNATVIYGDTMNTAHDRCIHFYFITKDSMIFRQRQTTPTRCVYHHTVYCDSPMVTPSYSSGRILTSEGIDAEFQSVINWGM